jgi:hypothetical protein
LLAALSPTGGTAGFLVGAERRSRETWECRAKFSWLPASCRRSLVVVAEC